MLESKIRYVLKNTRTGMYWGNNTPVKKLFEARRFVDQDQIDAYLRVSIYAPDKPEEYEPVQVQQTIREVGEDDGKLLHEVS